MKTTTQPNLIAACMLSIFLITERTRRRLSCLEPRIKAKG